MVSLKNCSYCGESITAHDEIALNKKLFAAASKRGEYICLECMAAVLDCTACDLRDKIEDYKREGCVLFD